MRIEKVLTVLKREYTSYTRKKLFWIMTFVGPLLPLLLGGLPALLMGRLVEGQKVLIYDGAGLGDALKTEIQKSQMLVTVEALPNPLPDENSTLVRGPLLEKKYDAIILLPAGITADPPAVPRLFTREGGNLLVQEISNSALSNQLRSRRLEGHGMSAAEISEIFNMKVVVDIRKISKTGKAQTGNMLQGFLAAMLITLMVMMPTLIWGQEMMRSIVEEKSQRIVEILISSVTPLELLAGKIAGIGLVGFTQIFLWFILTFGLGSGVSVALKAFGVAGFSMTQLLPLSLLPVMLLFFILGFVVYALLYAAVGSAVNSEKDAAQFAAPMTMVMMAPWFLIGAIAQAPDAPYVVALSMIPIYSPMLLTMRAGMGVLPFWQGAVGVALTLALIAFLLWACAKIFRVGILMYGQKPSLAEIVKWIGRA